jgi:hypothetical protein
MNRSCYRAGPQADPKGLRGAPPQNPPRHAKRKGAETTKAPIFVYDDTTDWRPVQWPTGIEMIRELA